MVAKKERGIKYKKKEEKLLPALSSLVFLVVTDTVREDILILRTKTQTFKYV